MSNLVHIANLAVCPGINFNPDRDTHDAIDAADHLWALLDDFGYQHCIYGCIGCSERMDKGAKQRLPKAPNGNYRTAFDALHNALGELPENLYNLLLEIANNDCPACAVLTALKQFPKIAAFSENPPIGWDTLPCHLKEDMDERGDYITPSVCHIHALLALDMSKLPSRMPPSERRDVRAGIAPGKAVIEFLRNFLDGRVQLSQAITDDDLWMILHWEPNGTLIPTREWVFWAKRELASASLEDLELYICRVANVALNCHDALENAGVYRYNETSEYGIEKGIIREMVYASYSLCKSELATNERTFTAFRNSMKNYFTETRWSPEETYCRLNTLGKIKVTKAGGKSPLFFPLNTDREADRAAHFTPPPITVTTANVIDNHVTVNSNAQALASGGDGGDGGTATVTIEKDAMKAESRIESGAVTMEANPTINVAAPDLKPIADILAPLVAKMAEPDNQSVSTLRTIPVVTPGNDAGRNQQMADAALWVEWQRKRGEGATKTEFSLEKGITVMELQTALDRHRDAKNGIVKTDATPTQTNAENIPPEGGMTTRGIIARKLNRTTATLRGWERDGVAPGGIPWPKGVRQGTTVLYRVAEVWPSLLKMTPDRDNAKDKQLLWEIMQIKEGEEDSDDGD